MGVFDQAARYATQAEPEAIFSRLLRGTGTALRLREWLDTRTTPPPGERDLTADLVAALVNESAPDQPWALVIEFQAQHDPEKLDATLAEWPACASNSATGRTSGASTRSVRRWCTYADSVRRRRST
jgi:hypothetical protein